MGCRKAGCSSARTSTCPACASSARPARRCPPEGFDWVYEQLGPDVLLNVGSGGTDVCSGIVQGGPLQPVYRGRDRRPLPGRRHRGVRPGRQRGGRRARRAGDPPADAVDAGALLGRPGRRALPRGLLRRVPGVWRHGDWIRFTERGSCVVTGRSDATLNRGGVRLGTSELYAVVEELDEVLDSLVVHLEDPRGRPGRAGAVRRLADGVELDDELRARLAGALRARSRRATCRTRSRPCRRSRAR